MRNEMQNKHAKELETRIEGERNLMKEQFEKLTTMLKNMAEEEQVCLTLEFPCG
jgi:endonuclease IV